MVGERGFTYPYGFRELALVGDAAGLEIEQDQPYGQRPSSLNQRRVERATNGSGGASKMQADWRSSRSQGLSIA